MTKFIFDQILIKSIPLKERTSFQMVNFHKQMVTTLEVMVGKGTLLNLKKKNKVS